MARPQVGAPALTEAKASPPATATGVVLPLEEPSPRPTLPQQYAAPLAVMAHVGVPPVLTDAKLNPPATATGVLRSVVEPSPSWPPWLNPQQ